MWQKWRIFRQVTKIITDEKLMQMKIIADKVYTNKVAQFSHDMQKNNFIAELINSFSRWSCHTLFGITLGMSRHAWPYPLEMIE